jgi:hypothetical protein
MTPLRPLTSNTDGGVTTTLNHPEEIRIETEFRFGDKVTARTAVRITPAGLICTGLMVAVIILSSAARVRAAR